MTGPKWGDMEWHRPRPTDVPNAGKLRKKLGEPPWTLEVPDIGPIPEELADMVCTLVWKGRRFKRVQPHEESCEVKEVDA